MRLKAATAAFFDNTGDLGSLTLGAVPGGKLTLSWTSGLLIRLQVTPSLDQPVWQDAPDTQGQNSATIAVGSGAFFRLVGP